MAHWDFLTNHALVLIHVIDHPRSTQRDISIAAGITDRAAFSILRALEEDGMISRQKEGRRNRYSVNVGALLRHRRQGPYSVEELAQGLLHLSQRALESAASEDGATQAVPQEEGSARWQPTTNGAENTSQPAPLATADSDLWEGD